MLSVRALLLPYEPGGHIPVVLGGPVRFDGNAGAADKGSRYLEFDGLRLSQPSAFILSQKAVFLPFP